MSLQITKRHTLPDWPVSQWVVSSQLFTSVSVVTASLCAAAGVLEPLVSNPCGQPSHSGSSIMRLAGNPAISPKHEVEWEGNVRGLGNTGAFLVKHREAIMWTRCILMSGCCESVIGGWSEIITSLEQAPHGQKSAHVWTQRARVTVGRYLELTRCCSL